MGQGLAPTMPKKPGSRRSGVSGKASAKAIAPNAFVALLPAVQRDVDARLRSYFEAELGSARRHGGEVGELVAVIRDVCLRGGKRLRPALAVAGFRAVDEGQSFTPALEAGLVLELLHTYFLIHDDWMDGDAMRRGGPSAHVLLARRFRSQRIGDASAILAGDYAIALATSALTRLKVPAKNCMAVSECFAEMQLAAVAGQQLDLTGGDGDVELTYALKTGSYTVAGPLRLGALLAGGRRRTLEALSAYARPLGVAFQLRDDLLSAFGDPAQTGKPLGNDLKSGKRTALIAHALRRARGKDRTLIRAVLGNPRASERALRQAVEAIERSGAREIVERRIDELVQASLGELDGAVSKQGRALLEGAARALTARRT